MLGKVLGTVTAAVFVGAAAVEISGYLARNRPGKAQLPPEATDQEGEAAKQRDQTAAQPGG